MAVLGDGDLSGGSLFSAGRSPPRIGAQFQLMPPDVRFPDPHGLLLDLDHRFRDRDGASPQPNGRFPPLKSRFAPGPRGPLGPLKKSLRSGIHARNPPKWSATPFISYPEKPKMGGFAGNFGRFWT